MLKVDILQFIEGNDRADKIISQHGGVWIMINNGVKRKIFRSLNKTTKSGSYEFIYLFYFYAKNNFILRLASDKSSKNKGKADKYIKSVIKKGRTKQKQTETVVIVTSHPKKK